MPKQNLIITIREMLALFQQYAWRDIRFAYEVWREVDLPNGHGPRSFVYYAPKVIRRVNELRLPPPRKKLSFPCS